MKIPYQNLSPSTLQALIEQFVLTEGTDYGEQEYTLSEKVETVKQQLIKGEAFISFSEVDETVTILTQHSS